MHQNQHPMSPPKPISGAVILSILAAVAIAALLFLGVGAFFYAVETFMETICPECFR